ncbi:MAG: hypothetical protein ACR2LJ_00165 [Acidimicrobiales bacterium]
MSEQRDDNVTAAATLLAIDELARLQHAVEVHGLGEFAADIWESDGELDEFLADLHSSRNSSFG